MEDKNTFLDKKTEANHLNNAEETYFSITEENTFADTVSQAYQQALRLLERDIYEILCDYTEYQTIYPGD